MRTYNVELGSRTLECATTFKANMLITDRVMDPLEIARDEAMFAEAQKRGLNYENKFKMNTGNVVAILHAGHEAAGGKLSYDEIGEMVMEAGVANMITQIGNYLAALVSGESKELSKKGKKAGASGNAG